MKRLLVGIMSVMVLAGCNQQESKNQYVKPKENVEVEKTEKSNHKNQSNNKKKDNKNIKEVSKTKTETAKKENNQQKQSYYAFVNQDGAVNILDPSFIKYYFSGNHTSEFANVKVGMSKSEVEAIYGTSNEQGMSVQSFEGTRYGDIVAVYDAQQNVKNVYINSKQQVSYQQVIQTYGKPSFDWNNAKEEDKSQPSFGKMLVYDNDKTNGFSVIIHFDVNNNVQMITQGKDNVVPDNTTKTKQESSNKQTSITKEQVKQFAVKFGNVDKEKQNGLLLNNVIDEGDHFIVTFTNMSNAGRPHEMHIDKQTGDYVMYTAGTQDIEAKGNINQ